MSNVPLYVSSVSAALAMSTAVDSWGGWDRVAAGLERDCAHQPGTLVALADYLHHRTGG